MKLDLTRDLVVLGSGTIAGQCVKLLRQYSNRDIYVFEQKGNAISVLKSRVASLCDVHYQELDRDHLEDAVCAIDPAVIFSINNTYLFQERLISRYPIINFHNSLLPRHPGRFAEAWTIYEMDTQSGITWHFVDRNVDTGNIIVQGLIPLDETITAIRLLARQHQLALTLFEGMMQALYSGKELMGMPQESGIDSQMHYSWQKPNNGILLPDWETGRISAFLRAMDYGKLAMLGIPCLMLGEQIYRWTRYSIGSGRMEHTVRLDKETGVCVLEGEMRSIQLHGLSPYHEEA